MQTTFLAHDTLEPRHDHQDSTQCVRWDSNVKDDETAEHIVRSSILKLLREDKSGSADPSTQPAEEAALASALGDMWALRPKASGSPSRFKA